jgi:hypothetical protein
MYTEADFEVVDAVRVAAALDRQLTDDEVARLEAPYRTHPVLRHS